MKKFIFLVVVLIFCSMFFVGCNKDEKEKLSIKNNNIKVYIDESYSLKDLGFEFGEDVNFNDFTFIIDNKYVVKNNDCFTFINLGETTFKAFLSLGKNINIAKEIKISVGIKENIECEIIQDVVSIDINSNYNLISNVNISDNLKNYVVFKDKNGNIINHNSTWENSGEFEIYAILKHGETNLSLGSFTICVENNIYVESVEFANENVLEIFENSIGVIDFNILPANANMFEIICENSNFKINKLGEFEAKGATDVFDVVVSFVNIEKVKCEKIYRVKIIEKIEIENVEIFLNESKINDGFINEKYKLKISFNSSDFNKEKLVLSSLIDVENIVEYDSYVVCDIEIKANHELKVCYLNESLFSEDIVSEFEVEFNVFELKDLSIKLINNLGLEFGFENGYESLYLVDYSKIGDNVSHAFGFEIDCKLNEENVDFSFAFADEFFFNDNGMICTKNLSENARVSIYILGKEFTFDFKIVEIEITEIFVSGYCENLIYGENETTNFNISYNCNYSTKIQKLKIEYDENYVCVSSNNISVVNFDFSKSLNKHNISFSIDSVKADIYIEVALKITKVVLKDLVNEIEYEVGENVDLKEDTFCFKLILYSADNIVVIDFDIVINLYKTIEGEKLEIGDAITFNKNYIEAMNVLTINESGTYLIEFIGGEIENCYFFLSF